MRTLLVDALGESSYLDKPAHCVKFGFIVGGLLIEVVTVVEWNTDTYLYTVHCVKIVQIRRFFWSVFSRIRTEYGKIRTRQKFLIWTLFHTVVVMIVISTE